MPHLSVRYGDSGLLLDFVWIGISEPRRRALAALGGPVPQRLRLTMMVDTGADSSMLNEQHLRSLQIPASGSRKIVTASSLDQATPCEAFDVSLCIETPGEQPFVVPALEVLTRPFFNQSIDGLLGRDVLNRVMLHIDGPQRRFRIDY